MGVFAAIYFWRNVFDVLGVVLELKEAADPDAAVLLEEHVRGLEIAVIHLLGLELFEYLAHPQTQVDDRSLIELLGFKLVLEGGQILAEDEELEHAVRLIVADDGVDVGAHAVHRGDAAHECRLLVEVLSVVGAVQLAVHNDPDESAE